MAFRTLEFDMTQASHPKVCSHVFSYSEPMAESSRAIDFQFDKTTNERPVKISGCDRGIFRIDN